MRRVGLLILILVATFTLTACNKTKLELVGDEVIYTKRLEGFDEGSIMVNGEEIFDFNITSDVDINTIGTYTLTYEYDGETITRTVEVIPNDLDNYLELVEALDDSDNFSLFTLTDIAFTYNGLQQVFFESSNLARLGNVMGGASSSSMVGETITFEMYVLFDNDVEHLFAKLDDPTVTEFSYIGEMEETTTTSVTEFDLSKVQEVEVTEHDGKTIYTVQLEMAGYKDTFDSSCEFLILETIALEDGETLEAVITVVDGNITEVTVDMTAMLQKYVGTLITYTQDAFTFKYEFTNYGQVGELNVPDEVVVPNE